MERIRQSFRRKKNKHKQQTESTFEADAVFDSAEAEEDPKPLSRIQKIRHSIRKLKKKNKHKNSDEDSDPVDDDKFTVDNNEEESCDDKVDEYSDKDEIDDVPLEKKSRFRLSFRKKKNKDKDDVTEHVQLKIKKDKKKKKGSGKWENDEERVRSNHCEFKQPEFQPDDVCKHWEFRHCAHKQRKFQHDGVIKHWEFDNAWQEMLNHATMKVRGV